jgi:hypothetical protein
LLALAAAERRRLCCGLSADRLRIFSPHADGRARAPPKPARPHPHIGGPGATTAPPAGP